MKLDIPNVFVKIYITLDGDNLIMNIRGQLFDILIEKFPEVYDKYVQYKGNKTLYMYRCSKHCTECTFF